MESKRPRLNEAGLAPDAAGELAEVLTKLRALVAQGEGEPDDGLDGLLEQLGRLQATLNGSSDSAFRAIEDAQARLQVGASAAAAAAAACAPQAATLAHALNASLMPLVVATGCQSILPNHTPAPAGGDRGAAGGGGPAHAAARLPPAAAQRRGLCARPADLRAPPELLVICAARLPARPAAVLFQAAGAPGSGNARLAAARVCT